MQDRLNFDEKQHIYKLDDVIIPSVTTIMRPLSTSLYKDIDEEVMRKAAQKGTETHQAIENYLNFGAEDYTPISMPYFMAFKDFFRNSEISVVNTEQKLFHELYRYAGTADLICDIGDKMYLIDFKTSVNVNEMLVRVQLEAYAMMCENSGIKIDSKAILHLKKDATYQLHEYPINDTEARQIFMNLLNVYNYTQKYIKR